jgi:Zn-dependent M28 family amino/carboxypeptidase
MKSRKIWALMVPCSIALTAQAQVLKGFSESNIRATIQELSSDAFAGRAPASLGEKLTTDYLVAQFEHYGLLAANRGSYLQEVPLLQVTTRADSNLLIQGGHAPLSLSYGDDFVVYTPRSDAPVSLANSSVVFAGYGIVAPEYGWNDYAGLDVKNKTVVVLVNDPGYATGDPKVFHGRAMTYYGRWTYKCEEAARQGAAAVLIVHDAGPAGYPWDVVHNTWTGPIDELPPDGAYRPLIQGWLSHKSAEQLFASADLSLEELTKAAARHGFKAVSLKVSANLTLHSEVKSIVSHNIVAFVKGTEHPKEVVIYTAHWDHLGTKVDPNGSHQIFHGAIDNGSGIAGLLELARVYSQERNGPKRSVLFLATTCEEQGLLGATYYVNHPLFPLANTVADLNMDIMNMYGETRNLAVRGRFMSSLDDDLQQQAKSLGLIVQTDAEPEKGYYYRADHFEFAKVGVPALSIVSGTDYVNRPDGWGLAQQQSYISQRYHKPADTYEPTWDLAGMLQQLDVLYLAGRKLADNDDWPRWYEGSPFRAARERTLPGRN